MSRAALLLLLGACVRQPMAAPRAQTRDVVFTGYSPLSRTAEIGRRTLTPLTYRLGKIALAASGGAAVPLGLLAGVAFVARHHLPPGASARTPRRVLATQSAAASPFP